MTSIDYASVIVDPGYLPMRVHRLSCAIRWIQPKTFSAPQEHVKVVVEVVVKPAGST